MSSYQPPGGQPPQGPPAYTPPQDPWGGAYEQGVASVPTDPIPQQQYGQYPPAGNDAWSQPTVPHGGQYTYVEKRRGRAGLLTVIFIAVLVLGGGGGYATYYFVKKQGGSALLNGNPPATTATTTPATTTWDPHVVKVGDCIVNKGTAAHVDMQLSPCSQPDSFKVIKVVTGSSIPEGAADKFDGTTSLAECGDTPSQNWYGYQDDRDDSKDVFLCLTHNGGSASPGT